jgi:hypothetical protein
MKPADSGGTWPGPAVVVSTNVSDASVTARKPNRRGDAVGETDGAGEASGSGVAVGVGVGVGVGLADGAGGGRVAALAGTAAVSAKAALITATANQHEHVGAVLGESMPRPASERCA